MTTEPTVYVVDDDTDVLRSLQWMLNKAGFAVEVYSSPSEFLSEYDPVCPGCVLLDLRMPEMDGLELMHRMTENHWSIPVIVLSGYGDVPTAVRAMKDGAIDFVEKPAERDVLLDRVRKGIERDVRLRCERARRVDVESRLALLTPRERQVMEKVITGEASKEIAYELSISVRTVEVHRSHIMHKLQVDSVADLVLCALEGGLVPTGEQDAPPTRPGTVVTTVDWDAIRQRTCKATPVT